MGMLVDPRTSMEDKQWLAWFAILIIGIALVGRLEASASPNYDYGDMRSALQFLRDMDNYYGQIARPSSDVKRSDDDLIQRYRRVPFNYLKRSSGCLDDDECSNLVRFLALQTADTSFTRLSRPRFGKRSMEPPMYFGLTKQKEDRWAK